MSEMSKKEAIAILQSAQEKYANKCIKKAFDMGIEALKQQQCGKWVTFTTIDGYTKYATCSCCGYERKVGMGCSLDVDNLPKFCECCGADMRKEGNEND